MVYGTKPDRDIQPFIPTREVDTGTESDAHIIEHIKYEGISPSVNYAFVKLNKVSDTPRLYDAFVEGYIFHHDGKPMDQEEYKRRKNSIVKRGRVPRNDRDDLERTIRRYFSAGIIREVKWRTRPTTISSGQGSKA